MAGLHRNRCLQAIRQALDAAGIAYRIERGGKHPRVAFELCGRIVKYPFPGSSSDRRSSRNASASIKRLIRERSPKA